MIFTLSFLLFIAQTCLANETCQNFPTTIRPKSFREGEWIDQVRVYSASQSHPKSTVSLFLAHYQTYCGFYELTVLSADSFVLYKGYYASRFYEHFYPFKAQITRSRDELNCKISLEQRECEYYRDLKRAVTDVNILYTDYKSMMIIHQCVDSRNYLMLVTRNDHFTDEDKAGIEKVLVDIMQDYKILIENQTFWWPTRDLCAEYLVDSLIPQQLIDWFTLILATSTTYFRLSIAKSISIGINRLAHRTWLL